MDKETYKRILRHLSKKEFGSYFFSEIIKNMGIEEANLFANLLKNTFDDINDYYMGKKSELSDDTNKFIENNKSTIIKIINDFEAKKENAAKDMMNKLSSNLGKDVVIQYWYNGKLQKDKIILTGINDFDSVILGDGTISIPFIGKNVAIYEITLSDGTILYSNPKVKDSYNISKESTIESAKRDIFGDSIIPQAKIEQPEPQKEDDKHIKCPYCDVENEIENAFCKDCGKKLDLSAIYANEYFEERLKEIEEKIEECKKNIKNNEVPDKKQYIELDTYLALKQLIIDNRDLFLADVSEYLKGRTSDRDKTYQEKINNLDSAEKELKVESKENKKKRIQNRINNLTSTIGEIRSKQRTVVNDSLSKAYDKMYARAQKLGKQNGTDDLYTEQLDILDDQVKQINDDLSDKKIKWAIQQLQLLILDMRIQSLQKKQGTLGAAIAKNDPDDDIIKFKI